MFLKHSKDATDSDGSFKSEPNFLTRESFGTCLATVQCVCHGDTVNTFLSPWATPSAMHAANCKAGNGRIVAPLFCPLGTGSAAHGGVKAKCKNYVG